MKECRRRMKGAWKVKTKMKEQKSGEEMDGWKEEEGRKRQEHEGFKG